MARRAPVWSGVYRHCLVWLTLSPYRRRSGRYPSRLPRRPLRQRTAKPASARRATLAPPPAGTAPGRNRPRPEPRQPPPARPHLPQIRRSYRGCAPAPPPPRREQRPETPTFRATGGPRAAEPSRRPRAAGRAAGRAPHSSPHQWAEQQAEPPHRHGVGAGTPTPCQRGAGQVGQRSGHRHGGPYMRVARQAEPPHRHGLGARTPTPCQRGGWSIFRASQRWDIVAARISRMPALPHYAGRVQAP